MSGSNSGPLQPTWTGFIQNSMDGLMLFEACLSGKLHHVPRRPHDRERASLIKSGSVFIYEENASGIKRWTDGVAWSPSRILGNFLIYRELEKPFPPGEKKRAMKRKRSQEGLDGRRGSEEEAGEYAAMPPTPPSPAIAPESKADVTGGQDTDKEMERQLIGSLVDSYGFRPNGLVKKTMSISMNGVSHHLVSYYTVDDVKNRKLNRPLSDNRLAGLTVRPELFMKQNFRAPVEETEHYAVDAVGHAYPHMIYSPMNAGSYALRPGTYGAPSYPMYSMASTTGAMYAGMPATAWPTPAQSSVAGGYSAHPYQTQGYDYYSRATPSTPQPNNPVKQEEAAHSASTFPQYSSAYQSSNRGSVSSNAYPPMQSHYQSPMRTSSQSYGPSGSVPPQHGPSSSTSGSTHQMYNAAQGSSHPSQSQYSAHNYAVQSSAQQSGSPHTSMKSPALGSTSHSLNALPPRSSLSNAYQGSYQGHDGAQSGGLNVQPNYGNPSGSHTSGAYTSSNYGAPAYTSNSQAYRPAPEGNAGVPAAGQY